MEFDEMDQSALEDSLTHRYSINKEQWRRSYRDGCICRWIGSGLRTEWMIMLPLLLHTTTL